LQNSKPSLLQIKQPHTTTELSLKSQYSNELPDRVTYDKSKAKPKIHAPFISPFRKTLLNSLKRYMYAVFGIANSVQILRDKELPVINFQIEKDPPSIFVNYRIKPDKLDAFKKALNLPKHVKFLPVSTLEGGKSEYLLSLNAYRVSGSILNQKRAEWSVYIDRGDGKPSFLIIDAYSDKLALDSKNLFTKPSDFTYTDEQDSNKQLDMSIRTDNEGSYSFQYPKDPLAESSEYLPDRNWMAANDYVFWLDGVCDMAFMNGKAFNNPIKKLPLEMCKSNYNLKWKEFIEENPIEVLALTEVTPMLVSPWANLRSGNTTDFAMPLN
jgi:hypothetical protein